jgi:hypothetical protein
MAFGATRPPANGGHLPTDNSDTGDSNRYCMHRTDCRHYKKSKTNGNTVGFETDTLTELKERLEGLAQEPGGIHKCGTCKPSTAG